MMRQLWHDILAHRLVASLFALFWVGSLVISGVFWGRRMGAQFLLVLIASVFVGWWRMSATTDWSRAHIIDSMRHSMRNSLVVAIVLIWFALATMVIVSWLDAPPIAPSAGRTMTWYHELAALLFIALLLGIIASVVGMLGGLIGGTLAYVFRRWRNRGGPPAPAGVS